MMNGSAIRTGACLLRAQILAVVDDLARQFALRLQLSANTHDTPEVRPVRPKKRSALIKPSLLLEATSHTAMGIAVGLAFAFLATHLTALGIATLINYSPTPDVVMIMFVGTCAITFGIGATLTGWAMIGENRPISLKVSGEGGSATSRQAESLGLIATELVINSLKHAFSENTKDGQITVRMKFLEQIGSFRSLTMELGSRTVSLLNQKPGLGTGIVKALAQQLGANVETLAGPEGTTVSVTHATFLAKMPRVV